MKNNKNNKKNQKKQKKQKIVRQNNYLLFKRTFDLIFAIPLFILSIPIIVIAMILVLKQDKTSCALFIQKRYGKNLKEFKIYKISSLRADSSINKNNNKNIINTEESEYSRVLKIGEFLRKTSIDELPQLFNIIKGDMSFIGPRPLLKDQFKTPLTQDAINRHNVKPGLSGKAQIQRNVVVLRKDKFKVDIEYINDLSFKQDVYIIYRTIITVLFAEKPDMKESLELVDET